MARMTVNQDLYLGFVSAITSSYGNDSVYTVVANSIHGNSKAPTLHDDPCGPSGA